MNQKLLTILLLSIFFISFASAVCTVTFDKESYITTETVSAEISCSTPQERNLAYTLNWTNQSGYQFELDTGTTPGTTGQTFYETYTISSDWPAGVWINATLPVGDLDGATDSANVTSTATATNSLLITNASVGGKYLGLTTSVKATVKDENGNKISGGQCRFSAWSNDETQMLKSGTAQLFDGNLKFEWILDYLSFAEGTDFAILLHCYCGSTGGSAECIDENGGAVTNSVGTTKTPFTTNTWITFNDDILPIVNSSGDNINASLFAGFDKVYWERNITNNYGEQLTGDVKLFIVNNDTGKSHLLGTATRTLSSGNATSIIDATIPQNLETGIYKIRSFADLYFNNIEVAQYILESETFNVTGIQDTMTINSITIKDYWGNTVNTSATTLSDSSMPTSNWTAPYTVLTEGFGYQICGNITNAYSDDIYWHMENLVIHNPTTGWSAEEFSHNSGNRWQRVLNSGDNDICWYSNLPLTIPTHSDYHFDFNIWIGDEQESFNCGTKCAFGGETQYLYIGAIEDSVVFDKWYTKPSAGADGVPLTFIVTEREEYLTMNDDCTYTDQETTDWNNASFMCTPKDGGAQIHENLSVYPRAGERFKVCFQTQNYLTTEVDLEFFDVYIDSDAGETVIFWPDETDGYIPSIQEDKLWLSETPSRAFELGGNLIDGYGIMCSKYMTLPNNIPGGNNWDIQGKVRINSDIYNLEEEVIWNWETDEFPIFGARTTENFMRLVEITNLTTNFLGSTATTGDEIDVTFTYDYHGYDDLIFIAEYCFEQTTQDDIEDCFETKFNPDLGTDNSIKDTFILPHSNEAGEAEVTLTIYDSTGNIKLGYSDPEPSNTFNITVSDLVINNVILDKDNFYTGESIHVCANITNTYNRRLTFELEYDVRCSADISDDQTLDRSLLIQATENRGVGAGQTQMQCYDVEIPYLDHLLYKTSGCYATVALNSEFVTSFTGYKTSKSSSNVNITDFGMYPEYEPNPEYPLVRLRPDWRFFDEGVDNVSRNYYRAKINITKLTEANLDPNNEITDNDWDVYLLYSDRMPCSQETYNYSVTLANGTLVNNEIEAKAITWLDSEGIEQQKCSLGIENVNFSDTDDDYFIAYIWFEDLEERTTEALESSSSSSGRSADALEGIENKTGTFHLDVACPSTGTIGSDISCVITAYVEDSQTMQKEVDFTCHISDGVSTYSSVNFNQMITRNALSMSRAFTVPSTFSDGTQYVLQCYADYYNLGSRRDSFYDTFTASTTSGGGGGSSGGASGEDEGGPGITGGAIDDGEPWFSPPDIDEFNPFSPNRNWAFMFIEAIILIGLIVFIIILIKKKKKHHHKHYYHHCKEKISWTKVFKTIGGIILILAILSGIGTGIFYGYKLLQNENQIIPTEQITQIEPVETIPITQETSSIFLQGNLTQSIFLIGLAVLIISLIILLFMTMLIILIVKLLDLRGEIRIGNYVKPYDTKLTKLQNKINKEILRKELKNIKK